MKEKKIYIEMLERIKGEVFRSGESLPSTRELAKLYRCHRFTVMRALQNLEAEGWIESSPRSRYRVSSKVPVTGTLKREKRKKRTLVNFDRILNLTPKMDLEKDKYEIEFWGGQPDLKLFPKKEFARTLSSDLRRLQIKDLNYGLVEGTENCLYETEQYLRRTRGLVNKKILMTNGSQEALLLAARALTKPGDTIAVESWGYPPAWRLFESLGLELVPIYVDKEGINVKDLANKYVANKFRFIYVTPLHQYPTTVGLSPRRRTELIEFCEHNHVPFLEDEYDHEFHYTKQPPTPLSMESDLGIYICSFSKVIFPGIRLGAIACQLEVRNNLACQKFLISRQTDTLSQLAFSAWLKDGGFDRHLKKMRKTYHGRMNFMQEHLRRIQTKCFIEWCEPTGGMSIWLDLKRDSERVAELAKKKGVFFQVEKNMRYDMKAGTHLRIGFAGVNENQIEKGVGVLESIL